MKCVHKQFTICILNTAFEYGKIVTVEASGKAEKPLEKRNKQ